MYFKFWGKLAFFSPKPWEKLAKIYFTSVFLI